MHPDWARSLRDQCRAAKVPFFFKQFGEWRELDNSLGLPHLPAKAHTFPDDTLMFRVGKKDLTLDVSDSPADVRFSFTLSNPAYLATQGWRD